MAEATGGRGIFYTGADAFGGDLKDHVAELLRSKGFDVTDVGTLPKYYDAAAKVSNRVADAGSEGARGVLVCGTGTGVAMVANRFSGVRAAVCRDVADAEDSRSINASNVLALGAKYTDKGTAARVLDAWLKQEFKGATAANNGAPWPADIHAFLDASLPEISALTPPPPPTCPFCALGAAYEGVPGVQGAQWKLFRKDRTTALVAFPGGAHEPPHHHSFGHSVYVVSGRKTVTNLTTGEEFSLAPGDYVYTPAGQVHSVDYHSDVEFFFAVDGPFDVFWDSERQGVVMPEAGVGGGT